MKLKVCGITTIKQLYQLEELKVLYAGFIFYPPSPRDVVKAKLPAVEVKKAKVKVYKVGVFVDATFEEVMGRVEEYGLDMVQLHGHETPYQCEKISAYIDVIKAFRFAENDHVKWQLQDYYKCSNLFLLDTGIYSRNVSDKTPDVSYTNRQFSWKRLSGLNIEKPFLLSGGVEPTDAASVKQFVKDTASKDLIAVDINSRFEITPGIKDLGKIKQFMEELK